MCPEQLFKALADGSRLKIVASLKNSEKFVEQLSMELNISVSTVSFHLKKLSEAGVVRARKEQYYQVYYLVDGVLDKQLFELIAPPETYDDEKFYRAVIDEYFVGGRVNKLPVQAKKREIVLKEVASRFERGRAYSIGEANVFIAELIDEFLVAKAEMLSSGLIREENGKIYGNYFNATSVETK